VLLAVALDCQDETMANPDSPVAIHMAGSLDFIARRGPGSRLLGPTVKVLELIRRRLSSTYPALTELVHINDRMPVILAPSSHRAWLNNHSTTAALTALLAPFPAEQMKSHPVSQEVNHANIDHEDLIRRSDPAPLAQPALF
jgi:hypothetical protein